MKKCGDMSASEYQGCYSHALHLAVCDVLYSKRTGNGSLTEESDAEPREEGDNDEDGDEELAGEMVIVEGGDEEGDEEFREDIKIAIGHVRQDVKTFRRSPKSNEVLQLNVQASFQK